MALDEEVVAALNSLWVLVAAIICFMLQAGFGLLEVGSVREKNAQNIMLKNIVDAAIAGLTYWAVGYALAYGEGGSPLFGNSYYFLNGVDDFIGWFFQMVFAGTTATIVSGAVAERCQFRAYLIYSFFLTGFIYPIVSHWIWSPDGFLYGRVLDFSGSGAVHLVGGAAAMAGSVFVGPRKGKFVKGSDGKWQTRQIPGHNVVLAALGAFVLWVGFFAFNGAACAAFFCPDYTTTGRIVTVTMLAGSTGCLFMLFVGAVLFKRWDLKLAINGLLAGMVATCTGCNVYKPYAAIIVGVFGSIGYYGQEMLFEYVLHIDDPLSASAVHMGAGAVGLLLVGFIGHSDFTEGPDQAGLFYGGNGKQLVWQVYAMLIYFAWAFGTCTIIFYPLRLIGWLRVPDEIQESGMDGHHHGGAAYYSETVEAIKKHTKDALATSKQNLHRLDTLEFMDNTEPTNVTPSSNPVIDSSSSDDDDSSDDVEAPNNKNKTKQEVIATPVGKQLEETLDAHPTTTAPDQQPWSTTTNKKVVGALAEVVSDSDSLSC